jgi:hypothetical protein
MHTVEGGSDQDAIARVTHTECKVVHGSTASSCEDHVFTMDRLMWVKVAIEDVVGKVAP